MRIALVGNPNSGKTTLFNALTGSTARVGNWPGVTVDRKEGVYKKLDEPMQIIDLPGIYSLSPYSPEEIIARNYIIEELPDLIINIVDATNLERNLYLTTQLLETDRPVVIALNMMDVLKKQGTEINLVALEKIIGVPVVPISAINSDGIKELMIKARDTVKEVRLVKSVLEDSYLGKEFSQIINLLKENDISNPVFHAVKSLENDNLEKANFSESLANDIENIRQSIALDEDLEGDFEAAVADARYRFISDNIASLVVKKESSLGLTYSDKIDKVLTNKFFGIPIFLFFMFVVFHVTFSENFLGVEGLASPGVWLQGLTDELMTFISDSVAGFLENQGAAEWTQGLVVDGVIAGVGAILSFLPQILMLFLFLSIMEDTGYMARAAFLMDRILRNFGLSGKAFMPLLMGFGCSVPAMMGTRTLENDKERRLAIMLMPFFSCGAKLPIWAIFSAAIFPEYADLVVFAIYIGGIVIAAIAAIILNRTLLKGEASPFIMELPAYHLPQIKSLVIHLWSKLKGFVLRASTIIAGSTVIIWFLANFDFSLAMVEANSAESILGVLGTAITPIFKPLGFANGEFAWKAIVAAITGLIAKEMVISTLGVLYNPEVEGDALEDEDAENALSDALAETFDPLSAISFMFFNLLSVPCMAAVATANAELRSPKWTAITICFWLFTAWIVSFLIYNIGSLLGFAS